MHGREVGNIVEKAAEEDIVAKGVYWSGVFFTLSVSPKRKFETERKKVATHGATTRKT